MNFWLGKNWMFFWSHEIIHAHLVTTFSVLAFMAFAAGLPEEPRVTRGHRKLVLLGLLAALGAALSFGSGIAALLSLMVLSVLLRARREVWVAVFGTLLLFGLFYKLGLQFGTPTSPVGAAQQRFFLPWISQAAGIPGFVLDWLGVFPQEALTAVGLRLGVVESGDWIPRRAFGALVLVTWFLEAFALARSRKVSSGRRLAFLLWTFGIVVAGQVSLMRGIRDPTHMVAIRYRVWQVFSAVGWAWFALRWVEHRLRRVRLTQVFVPIVALVACLLLIPSHLRNWERHVRMDAMRIAAQSAALLGDLRDPLVFGMQSPGIAIALEAGRLDRTFDDLAQRDRGWYGKRGLGLEGRRIEECFPVRAGTVTSGLWSVQERWGASETAGPLARVSGSVVLDRETGKGPRSVLLTDASGTILGVALPHLTTRRMRRTGRAASFIGHGQITRLTPDLRFFALDRSGKSVVEFRPQLEPVEAPTILLVEATEDSGDADPGDGSCADARGRCSLRAAVQEANAWREPTTIQLASATTFRLTGPAGPGDPAGGDLDLLTEVTLQGPGSGGPAVIRVERREGASRIFEVPDDAGVTVTLRNLVLQGGVEVEGGAMRVGRGNDLVLERVSFVGNRSVGGGGGGLWTASPVTGTNVVFRENQAAGSGGGLRVAEGSGSSRASLMNAAFVANRADAGGGLSTDVATWLTNTTISGNRASTGGGLAVGSGTTRIAFSTIAANKVGQDGEQEGASFRGGGGIWAEPRLATVRLHHSVVADNKAFPQGATSRTAAGSDCAGRLISDGWLAVESVEVHGECSVDSKATDSLGRDPGLEPLDSEALVHRFPESSPLLDAGGEKGCAWDENGDGIFDTALPFDLLGGLRPMDGNGDSLAACDIGSWELGGDAAARVFSDGFESGETCSWAVSDCP